MVHKALKAAEILADDGEDVGVVDVFMLRPLDGESLYQTLSRYKTIITLEEAFKNKAGLDSIVSSLILSRDSNLKLHALGYGDSHVFDAGNRESLAELNGCGLKDITRIVGQCRNKIRTS